MPHLPPAHHEISKYDSPNETKVKGKINETIADSNLNLTKSMTHHNQTKKLTTWFLTFHGSISTIWLRIFSFSMLVEGMISSLYHKPFQSQS
jgi:CRISPR/Cas system endoribonuclease Cas6 (RAMP superfamily)